VSEATEYKSFAEWPREVHLGWAGDSPDISSDTHGTREQAEAVCQMLHENGLGGNRITFPIRTWVEPAARNPAQ
jgi:hypothetical protein